MKIILAGIETMLLEAWGERFHGVENWKIYLKSLIEVFWELQNEYRQRLIAGLKSKLEMIKYDLALGVGLN